MATLALTPQSAISRTVAPLRTSAITTCSRDTRTGVQKLTEFLACNYYFMSIGQRQRRENCMSQMKSRNQRVDAQRAREHVSSLQHPQDVLTPSMSKFDLHFLIFSLTRKFCSFWSNNGPREGFSLAKNI